MQVEAIEVRTLERTLAEGLESSRGAEHRRPVVLVRAACDLGEGWGECVALAAPTYSEEHAGGAVSVLRDHLAPLVLAAPAVEGPPTAAVPAALGAMAAIRGHAMAKAAVEMAVLDAALRAEGRSLAAFLGARRGTVPAGATLGLASGEAPLLAAAEAAVAAGYRRLKCKVAPGRSIAPLEALRRAHPEIALSVDANGAFREEDAEDRAVLEALDRLGLVAIEQPLAPDDLVGHARLAAALETPVLLDESVRSLGQLETAAALHACDGVAVKPGPLGGVLAAKAVHDGCVARGLSCAIGGMLETGLGRAASLAVAALDGFDLPGDLGASERYFRPELTEEHVLVGGAVPVPEKPGIGRVLRPWVLETARLVGSCRASR